MSRVFISYSRKDLVFVKRLVTSLQAAGFEPWYDLSNLQGGSGWGQELQEAIQASQFFIVIISPQSVRSEWVEREFLFASSRKIKIIPILHGHCELPIWCLNLQAVDFWHQNYQLRLNDLLSAMGEGSIKEASSPESSSSPAVARKAPRHNLPAQLTSFVGREKEIGQVRQAVINHRLVTLTGAGGTGKTRLSLQVAGGLLEQFSGGTWFVDLALLTNPELIPQAILSAAGVVTSQNRDAQTTLKDFLRGRACLLILDNCEHLALACATLVESILKETKDVKVLATSREALGVPGELIWRVPPLSMPGAKLSLPIDSLLQFETVRLFCERGTLASPEFRITSENAEAVIEICRRLDGIPLAIELAAARLRMIDPQQIASHLDDRFHLLTGGSRTALPRHQTLRALIDWSYSLLTREEQILLNRLSVFSGGWTLEAAEEVCRDDGQQKGLLDVLTHLIDKSLVQVGASFKDTKSFSMLETIKQYGNEKLSELDDEGRIRRRHLEYFLDLVEKAHPHFFQEKQMEWLDRVEKDHANLISALDFVLVNSSISQPEFIGYGMRLCNAMFSFWYRKGYWNEAKYYLMNFLEATKGLPISIPRARMLYQSSVFEDNMARAAQMINESITHCRKLNDKAGLAYALRVGGSRYLYLNENIKARSYLEESLSIFRKLNDKWGIASVSLHLGQVAWFNDRDPTLAKNYYMDSIKLFRELGDLRGVASGLNLLSVVYSDMGELKNAYPLIEECLGIGRELDDTYGISWALNNLGWMKMGDGDYISAEILLKEGLELARDLGMSERISSILGNLGQAVRFQGDYRRSDELYSEALLIAQQSENKSNVAWCLLGLGALARIKRDVETSCNTYLNASVAARQLDDREMIAYLFEEIAAFEVVRGNMTKAASLLGKSSSIRSSILTVPLPVEQKEINENMVMIKSRLTEEAFTSAWEKGCSMTLGAAMEYAVADLKGDNPTGNLSTP